MATVHDKYVVELAEVIKGYGNPPDVNDPFCLSEFYRFYEIPNVCVSAENFKKMRPLSDFTEENEARVETRLMSLEPRPRGKWIERNPQNSPDCRLIECSECGNAYIVGYVLDYADWIDGRNFCTNCGADMRTEEAK